MEKSQQINAFLDGYKAALKEWVEKAKSFLHGKLDKLQNFRPGFIVVWLGAGHTVLHVLECQWVIIQFLCVL